MRILLSSAIRAASTASPIQEEHQIGLALRLYLTITSVPASPAGIKVVVRGYAGAVPTELTAGGAAATAPGTYVYEMGVIQPAALLGTVLESSPRPVPSIWDALVKHTEATNYVYELRAELV